MILPQNSLSNIVNNQYCIEWNTFQKSQTPFFWKSRLLSPTDNAIILKSNLDFLSTLPKNSTIIVYQNINGRHQMRFSRESLLWKIVKLPNCHIVNSIEYNSSVIDSLGDNWNVTSAMQSKKIISWTRKSIYSRPIPIKRKCSKFSNEFINRVSLSIIDNKLVNVIIYVPTREHKFRQEFFDELGNWWTDYVSPQLLICPYLCMSIDLNTWLDG